MDVHSPGAHTRYRADIDGLRAIAVLLVVAFHAFPGVVKGGFVGVDVFFVISGFLITAILIESLEQDRFSFVTFYSRRISRIFPALILVLVATYALGWNSMFTIEFTKLVKHIGAGAGFLSNVALWRESGYFDTFSETKPLLHLWSLAIEEQFYIVWPALLWLVWRRRLSPIGAIAAVGILSFAINLWTMNRDAVADFYSPLTRFWEIAIGAALASLTSGQGRWASGLSDRARNVMSVAGLVLIVGGAALISEDAPFPGWRALLPTIGAALLIAAGSSAWVNRSVLSRPALVWIGLISYPLYLWHWPLLAFERVVLGVPAPAMTRVLTVAVAFLLAWVTYKAVEKPLRARPDKRRVAAALLVAMFMVGSLTVASYVLERRQALPRKFLALNPLGATGFDGADGGLTVPECGVDSRDRDLYAQCLRDSREPARYAILGDSKAAALFAGVFRTSSPGHRWLFIGGNGPQGAPVPVISDAALYARYQPATRIALASLARNPAIETVALVTAARALFQLERDDSIDELPASTNYTVAFQGLSEAVRQLVRSGKRVVLVVDNPTLADPTICLKRVTRIAALDAYTQRRDDPRCHVTIARHLELSRQYRALLDEVARLDPVRIRVLDTLDEMCDRAAGVCLPVKDGRLMYWLTDHVSDYAAGLIGRDLNELVRTF